MDTDRLYDDPVDGPETKHNSAPDTIQNRDLTEIDLHALARKVYALMKEELRIERERLGYSR